MERVVTHDEANEILSRFIASHFRKDDAPRARFSIPVDESRDDDVLLDRYIKQNRERDERLDEIKRHWQDGIGDVHENPWRRRMAELVGDTEGLNDKT